MVKYWFILKTQLANRLAYPGDVAARSIGIVIFMVIFAYLWRATYGGASSIAGLSLHDTLWYLLIAEVIVLSKPRLSRTIAEAVKDGSIAYLLNKPYHFLLYHWSVGFADSLTSMVFNALAGGAVVWLLAGAPPDVRGWPMVILAMLGGWAIDFCFSALIGLSAFVAEEVSAFEWIYQKLLFLLGGLLLPLDFFPDWLRVIAQASPFGFTIYGPARLFVQPELARFAGLVLGQAAWIAVLGGTVVLFYQKAITRLTINGG